MKLFLMRHGQAERYRGEASDAARALTEVGRSQARTAASIIVQSGIPQKVYTSPYLRTQQTAAAVMETIGATGTELAQLNQTLICETKDWLTPESDVKIVCDALASDTAEALLLVSHMPLVSVLTAYLTEHSFAFDTGQVASIELSYFHRGQGDLKWVQ